jgi:FAD/FMN-containing dehydrogenase
VVAADTAARARLWQIREGLPEALNREGVAHSIDAALPLPRLPAFIGMLPPTIERASPGARVILFGHLLDGNVHVNVLGPAIDDPAVDDAVLDLAIEMGGSVSAEHGIGIAKTGWLPRDRGHGDIEAMRAIKRALDPDGILNPGVLLG